MNYCTQSEDGDLEERSDKGLVEEPIGQDPSGEGLLYRLFLKK
jgi:hypothetical protein